MSVERQEDNGLELESPKETSSQRRGMKQSFIMISSTLGWILCLLLERDRRDGHRRREDNEKVLIRYKINMKDLGVKF